MDVLYVSASGAGDPTRASIPWHLAVNGSVVAGQSAAILILGDAAEVLRNDVRAELVGVGVPPIDELISKAYEHSLPIFV